MKTHRKPLSRYFPATHPRKGEPTFFVEKLIKSLSTFESVSDFDFLYNLGQKLGYEYHGMLEYEIESQFPKAHTIRQGNKVKVGDFIQFYVWSGRPYHSKQIVIAQPIEVKKVWDFEVDLSCVYSINGKYTDEQTDYNVALNDGLSESDFQFWFMPDMKKPKEFKGQIICWVESIEY